MTTLTSSLSPTCQYDELSYRTDSRHIVRFRPFRRLPVTAAERGGLHGAFVVVAAAVPAGFVTLVTGGGGASASSGACGALGFVGEQRDVQGREALPVLQLDREERLGALEPPGG